MTKTLALIAVSVAALSTPAIADGHKGKGGNSEAAKGMAAAAPSGIGGFPGASIARTLKGENKGGWGNVGSSLLESGIVAPAKR